MPQPTEWSSTLIIGAMFAVVLCLFIIFKRRGRYRTVAEESPIQPPSYLRASSLDGCGAGDHDQPYRFGTRPNALLPYPFNTHQYARLLLLRSRWQDGLASEDDRIDRDARELAAPIGPNLTPPVLFS